MRQNFESTNRIKPIKHLVIHSFALSPQKMLDTLRCYGLSTHYMIDSTGDVYSLVAEERVSWHAGSSFWFGDVGLNQTSIGIELEHLDYGQTAYPSKQIQTLIQLVKGIIGRYQIRPENIVGHSDIAPEAKADPGTGFPWQELSKQGIGLWYDLKDGNKIKGGNVSQLLSMIGYPTQTQHQLIGSSWAFRQRFIPETVPYDPDLSMREERVFKARQMVSQLPLNKQKDFFKIAPVIYPENAHTCLSDPEFIKTLRSVAYTYQKAREI